MLPFRRILFPVDYSPSCRAVIPYVQDMARRFHAQLTVIHAFALRPNMAIPNPHEALVSTLNGHRPAIPYKSILCAVDESPEAEAVLKAGSAMAASYEARLKVMHALGMFPSTPDMDLSPYRDELFKAAEVRLDELKSRLGIDAPHVVIQALLADAVREQALAERADLVITGRGHAQGGISRIWSNLYSIVRDAPCPVLSVSRFVTPRGAARVFGASGYACGGSVGLPPSQPQRPRQARG